MFEFLFAQRDHWILVRGLLAVFILAAPVNLFVAAMGSGAPDSKGFLRTLGVVLGMELFGVLIFAAVTRVLDSILMRGIAWSTYSWFGIIGAAAVFTVGFNVFVDHLFQFKQGNYAVSVYGFLGLIAFCVVVVLLGELSLRIL